jgi:phenylpyruvate tautomerase PptA (4-oxalocrotonate tautomerase family)
LIVELLSGNKQDILVERQLINTSTKIIFDLLEPKKYTIKIIIDSNKNNEWDTGNFLKKQFPERILYHKELTNFELRANFFLEETFDVE